MAEVISLQVLGANDAIDPSILQMLAHSYYYHLVEVSFSVSVLSPLKTFVLVLIFNSVFAHCFLLILNALYFLNSEFRFSQMTYLYVAWHRAVCAD